MFPPPPPHTHAHTHTQPKTDQKKIRYTKGQFMKRTRKGANTQTENEKITETQEMKRDEEMASRRE